MAAAVLGRRAQKPIGHARFLDLARHDGFEPIAGASRDPETTEKGAMCEPCTTAGPRGPAVVPLNLETEPQTDLQRARQPVVDERP